MDQTKSTGKTKDTNIKIAASTYFYRLCSQCYDDHDVLPHLRLIKDEDIS